MEDYKKTMLHIWDIVEEAEETDIEFEDAWAIVRDRYFNAIEKLKDE
jgi:hypothetical protein